VGEAIDASTDQGEPEPEQFSLAMGNPAAFVSGSYGDDDRPSMLLTRESAEDRQRNPGTSVQGCIATVGCGCGQPFVMDLLTDNIKSCPGCGQSYTSLLVVAAADDDQIFGDVLDHLRVVNEGEATAEEPPEEPTAIPDA
jgi:hypothetical protein